MFPLPTEVQQRPVGLRYVLVEPGQEVELGDGSRLVGLHVLQVEAPHQEVIAPDVLRHQVHLRGVRKQPSPDAFHVGVKILPAGRPAAAGRQGSTYLVDVVEVGSLVRPVVVALLHAVLHQGRQHHNHHAAVLPDHLQERETEGNRCSLTGSQHAAFLALMFADDVMK